jgi:hypothetical protein
MPKPGIGGRNGSNCLMYLNFLSGKSEGQRFTLRELELAE